MNDYDDLFDKSDNIKPEIIIEKTNPYDKQYEDFYNQAEEDKRNGLLLAIYILVSLFISFASGLIIQSEYSYLDEAIDDIRESVTLTYIVNDSDDLQYPYEVVVNGEYYNNYDKEIPLFTIQIEFFNESDESMGFYTISKENFQANSTYIVNEEILTDFEPSRINYVESIDAPSIIYTLIALVQVTITTVIFFIVDKLNFKKDWEDFKRNKNQKISMIFTGFLLVYASLIFANLVLTLLGVSGTSENELLIQSLFSDSPLTLFLLFLLLCVFTPIVEEVVFRKVIYNFIEPRSNYKVAIAVTGLVFGLMHVISYGDFIQSIPYVLMGLVFGYIYWKSNKNIYVTIGVHFLNNFVSWLLYVLMIYGIYA